MTSTRRPPAPPASDLRARWRALRRRYGWLDHLARAVNRYIDDGGYHYAASITYFTVLSLVPMLMMAISVAAFVLAGQPALLNGLRREIPQAVPAALAGTANDLVTNIIDHRLTLGLVGLAVAGYSGWNWMNALRDALTAMWYQDRTRPPVLATVLRDLAALVGLALALVVSLALSAVGGAFGQWILRLAGLASVDWAHTVLSVLSVPLSLAADWLVFLWVLTRLPRRPVTIRAAWRGAVAAAIGFELLKQAGNAYFQALGRSPTGATFGSAVGLLVFIYLVARLLMVTTAWLATATPATDAAGRRAIPPPPPRVLRAVPHRRVPSPRVAAALLGLGAAAALLAERTVRPRR